MSESGEKEVRVGDEEVAKGQAVAAGGWGNEQRMVHLFHKVVYKLAQ